MSYHDIGVNQLSVQHKGILVSVAKENILSDRGAATA